VGSGGHPASAAFTAAINSLISTTPSPDGSKLGQALIGDTPRAISTPRTRSVMRTMPLPLQSPTQYPAAARGPPRIAVNAPAAASAAKRGARRHGSATPRRRANTPPAFERREEHAQSHTRNNYRRADDEWMTAV
jgi:hypothetical protein